MGNFYFPLIFISGFLYRREKAARGPATDKETLMKELEEQETHPENFSNELYDPMRNEV